MAKLIAPFAVIALLTLTASFSDCQHHYQRGDPYSHGGGYYYEEPAQGSYEPQVRQLQLSLPKPFKKVSEDMRKQTEDAMSSMEAAGKEMTDSMQKPFDDMATAMEGRTQKKNSTADSSKEKSSSEEENNSNEEKTTKKPDSAPYKSKDDPKEVVPEPKRIEYPVPDFVDVDVQPRPRFYFDFYE